MAPTIPHFRSPRGRCAAITVSSSSSGSEQSATNTLVFLSSSSGSDESVADTLVILSSTTFSSSVVVVPDSSASRGGDEATGGQRSAPRHRRPPSPAPSAVPVRSPAVVTAASFANGSGHVGTSRRTAAAPQRCPSPCSVLSVRAPGGVAPAPPSSGNDDDDEATSRPKRKLQYRKWDVADEYKVLATLAELRRDNLGVRPQISVLLRKICDDGGLLRRGVDAAELSDKLYQLKKKFKRAAVKVAATGGRRLRKHRNRLLYKISMEVWPELLGDVQVQVARAGRVRL